MVFVKTIDLDTVLKESFTDFSRGVKIGGMIDQVVKAIPSLKVLEVGVSPIFQQLFDFFNFVILFLSNNFN